MSSISVYAICNCFKFHGVTLTQMLGPVFTFASNYYQTASFFIPGRHCDKESNNSWAAGKCSNVVAETHAGTRKSVSDFWLRLARTAYKFRLNPISTRYFLPGVTPGGSCFHLHPVTSLSSKLDDSNFVQNYFGGSIFCDKKIGIKSIMTSLRRHLCSDE